MPCQTVSYVDVHRGICFDILLIWCVCVCVCVWGGGGGGGGGGQWAGVTVLVGG